MGFAVVGALIIGGVLLASRLASASTPGREGAGAAPAGASLVPRTLNDRRPGERVAGESAVSPYNPADIPGIGTQIAAGGAGALAAGATGNPVAALVAAIGSITAAIFGSAAGWRAVGDYAKALNEKWPNWSEEEGYYAQRITHEAIEYCTRNFIEAGLTGDARNWCQFKAQCGSNDWIPNIAQTVGAKNDIRVMAQRTIERYGGEGSEGRPDDICEQHAAVAEYFNRLNTNRQG